LEYPLRNIKPDRASLAHGRFPWWLLNTATSAHRGRRGASTPSTPLETELAARPQPAPGKAIGRQRDAVAVLKQERDQLAERLAQIEAYQPGITAKAKAWWQRSTSRHVVDEPAIPPAAHPT
jgi:hypothetical protein